MTKHSELLKAISICGNQTKFADRLSEALAVRGENRVISQQIVSYWLNSRYGLPEIYCLDLEAMLNYQVSKHKLRPDKFGATAYVSIEDIAR